MDSHSVSLAPPGLPSDLEWRVDVPMRSFQGGQPAAPRPLSLLPPLTSYPTQAITPSSSPSTSTSASPSDILTFHTHSPTSRLSPRRPRTHQ